MPRPTSLQRLAAAASVVATLVVAVGGATTVGDSSGTMTVSGGTVETVRFAGGDILENLRSQLAANGTTAAPGQVVSLAEEGAGICYAISGEIIVSSNITYDLLVSGDSSHPGLRFLAEVPTDYGACARGEQVSDSMYAASDPPGGWVIGQSRTSHRVHGYTLGLIVDPTNDPLEALAGASFTVLAQPAS